MGQLRRLRALGRPAKRLVRRIQARRDARTVARFHQIFYDAAPWSPWLGARTLKNPLDLWIYQEILTETQPEVIVETGTHRGGSALYLASVCDVLGRGTIVSIDIAPFRDDYPSHPRITYLTDRSSTDPAVLAEVASLTKGCRTMVILDSDHSQRHVEAELHAYAPLVSEGCYLVVEDSNIGLIRPDLVPGPREAIETFLASNAEFEVDRSRERFLLTYNPSGYLRRVAPVPSPVAAPVQPELEAQPPATAAVTPASVSAA